MPFFVIVNKTRKGRCSNNNTYEMSSGLVLRPHVWSELSGEVVYANIPKYTSSLIFPVDLDANRIRLNSATPVQFGWKVVYTWAGQYFSATTSCPVVEYKRLDWVFPPGDCGPLCAFNNELDANFFRQRGLWHRDNHKAVPCAYCGISRYKESHGWTKLWDSRGHVKCNNFPKGTVFCERIMLL